MRRRCFRCFCLQEESSVQYSKRIKHDLKAKFFCKGCKRDPKLTEIPKMPAEELMEALSASIEYDLDIKPTRRKFESCRVTTHDVLNPVKKVKKIYDVSYEESCAMGMFKRKCPINCYVDIIEVEKGNNFSNLIYCPKISNFVLAKPPYSQKEIKNAIEWTKEIKAQCLKAHPFTPMPEGTVSLPKKTKSSKYKKMKRVEKKQVEEKITLL